ncbi:uncharacterized protein CLUP02_17230 [Colletotrichum lupini]|uniref:Uncharacterized protein n=1 Tax=Colletotrichum lupini TaxID=145971 RepID=A0A9Q8SFU3_9PEZI|nr:uncharacterized protein CLUP02_17230 [Colletotrichum lupini]UQC75722.1 hypothetical protein CLUP02_17230 [Colletotrichum lupini]
MTAETPTIEPIPLAHITSVSMIPRERQREFVTEMDTKGEIFRSEYRRVKLLIEMLEFRAEKNRSIYRDVPARLREARQKKRTMKRMMIEALRKHKEDELDRRGNDGALQVDWLSVKSPVVAGKSDLKSHIAYRLRPSVHTGVIDNEIGERNMGKTCTNVSAEVLGVTPALSTVMPKLKIGVQWISWGTRETENVTRMGVSRGFGRVGEQVCPKFLPKNYRSLSSPRVYGTLKPHFNYLKSCH